jgi:methyl-accepting chemotaxis protein
LGTCPRWREFETAIYRDEVMDYVIASYGKLAALFNNLKIATKIAVGFVVVLTIMVAMSINSYFGIEHIGEDFHQYAERVSAVDAVSKVDREFLHYRRYVSELAKIEDQSKISAKILEEEKRVNAAIDLSKERIHDSKRSTLIGDIKDKFGKYAKLVHKAEALRAEKDQIGKTVLDVDGDKLRKDLEILQSIKAREGNTDGLLLAADALKEIMQVRISVNKILGRQDSKAKATAEQAFKAANQHLASLEGTITSHEARQAYNEVKELMAEYREGFERAVALDKDFAKITGADLPALAKIVEKDSKIIHDSAVAEEHALEKDAKAYIISTERTILGAGLVGLLLGGLLAWAISQNIAQPIRTIAAMLMELAKGNKDVEIPYADRRDEVGENAAAARVFKDNLVRMEQMEAEKKDAERIVAEQRKADLHRLADEFQSAVGGIVDTVASASSQLESAANALTKTADTTQQLSGMVAAASEQTSANVQGVATASEELSSTVLEISRQVQQSTGIADQAVTQAAKTNECVKELSESAERIGNVIELINSIAGQTNLLALNATIEAARAGDAGKGFAVVAQEVKTLASQTGKATDEISSQIASMQSATLGAVGAIREISETINKISEISGAIAAAVEQQGATTQEISRNVIEAAKGTTEVAGSITDVSRGASETGSASGQVLSSAQKLSSESGNLRQEVDRFLSTVRAA